VPRKTMPYGSWKSPITSEMIVAQSIILSEPRLDGEHVYWLEGRPQELGRLVVVRANSLGGHAADMTPKPYNARTRVHEYGGYSTTGIGQLAVLDLRTGALQPFETPFTEFSSVRADNKHAVCRAGAPNHPASIVAFDLASGTHRVLKKETDLLDQTELRIAEYLSMVKPVEFPTGLLQWSAFQLCSHQRRVRRDRGS
jgi:hypothetical protein